MKEDISNFLDYKPQVFIASDSKDGKLMSIVTTFSPKGKMVSELVISHHNKNVGTYSNLIEAIEAYNNL